MKRYIQAANATQTCKSLQSQIAEALGLTDYTKIQVTHKYGEIFEVYYKDSGKSKEIRVNSTKVKGPKKSKYIPWDSSYTIDADGTVYDAQGEEVGEVKIFKQLEDRREKTSYHPRKASFNDQQPNVVTISPQTIQQLAHWLQ